MLPVIAAAAFGLLLLNKQAKKGEAAFDLDAALPAPEAHHVIDTIRRSTVVDIARLDAMARDYAQRGLPFTAQTIAYRSWELRGRPGSPPTVTLATAPQGGPPQAGAPQAGPPGAAPRPTNGVPTNGAPAPGTNGVHTHNGVPHANGAPAAGPPPNCYDAQVDTATCMAVTSALATETNADKLHAFAESLRTRFPQAAAALDARAGLLGGAASQVRTAPPSQASAPASHAGPPAGAMATPAPQAAPAPATTPPMPPQPAAATGGETWTPVAPDLSNVPADYHPALVEAVQGLVMDMSMVPGSERAMAIGDRMFVFMRPLPAPGVPPGAVWVTRMTDVGSGSGSAATGYGSGPLWPVDIVDGRRPPPDRRFVGSPTIMDGSPESLMSPQAILSPQAIPMEMMMPGGLPGGGNIPASPMVVVGGDDLAAAVAAAPPGGATQPMPEIFGASMPEIVGGEIAGIPAPPFGLDEPIPPPPPGLSEEANAVAQQGGGFDQGPMEGAPQQMTMDRRSPVRPTPSAHVLIRPSDSVWPPKLAKIGSGNKRSYDQLVELNPHLVSPAGAWPQLYPGDEVNVPMQWIEALRSKGFLVKMDPGVAN
jgi:hypothetical protein